MDTVSSKATLIELIKQDHEEIFSYYDKYTESKGDQDAQARWGRQLIWEVARHSAGEEIVVYPLFEKHLGAEGKKMADSDRADHLEVKKLLAQIEKESPGTAAYDGLLKQVIEELTTHITTEEQNDLPSLEAALGTEASISIGKSFKRTKMFVPTRAHPSAPDKPPFETLAGFLAAPLDKLKDAFAKFPTEESK